MSNSTLSQLINQPYWSCSIKYAKLIAIDSMLEFDVIECFYTNKRFMIHLVARFLEDQCCKMDMFLLKRTGLWLCLHSHSFICEKLYLCIGAGPGQEWLNSGVYQM